MSPWWKCPSLAALAARLSQVRMLRAMGCTIDARDHALELPS